MRLHSLEETEVMGLPEYPEETGLVMTLPRCQPWAHKGALRRESFLLLPPHDSLLEKHSSDTRNPNITEQEKMNEMPFPRTMISEQDDPGQTYKGQPHDTKPSMFFQKPDSHLEFIKYN